MAHPDPHRPYIKEVTLDTRMPLAHTHVIDPKNIEPRIIWQTLHEYRRPLDDDDPADRAFIDDVSDYGVREPIILFEEPRIGALWLISGGRRLEAHRLTQDVTVGIKAIVCRDPKSLFDALIAEREAQNAAHSTFEKPTTWRDKLQLGVMVNGTFWCYRSAARSYTPGAKTHKPLKAKVYEFNKFLGIGVGEWHALRMIACIYKVYGQHSTTVHNVDLAEKLLDQVDAGTLNMTSVRTQYRPITLTHKGVLRSKDEWEKQLPMALITLNQAIANVTSYEKVADQVPQETIRSTISALQSVITRMRRSIRFMNESLTTMEDANV